MEAQDSVVQSLALTSINRRPSDGGDGMRDGDPHYDRPHFDRKGQRESADLCSILRRPSDGGHEMRDENTMQQKESKAKGGIPANLRSIRRRPSYWRMQFASRRRAEHGGDGMRERHRRWEKGKSVKERREKHCSCGGKNECERKEGNCKQKRKEIAVMDRRIRGHDDCDEENYWHRYLKVVLCIGGSDVLVYQPYCKSHKYTGGLLPFKKSKKMSQIRVFLADKRITVACVGARDAAEKLAEEWEVHVARPAELTDMFARAFGKAAGVEPEKEPKKWWMSKAELRRARAKAEAEKDDECDDEEAEHRKQGKRPAKVVSGRSLERMARVCPRLAVFVARSSYGGHESDDLTSEYLRFNACLVYSHIFNLAC
ncbi:hypothetical protein GUJ93_ZPchr0001g29954 [Zizania palustris]|uniref:Uncharacterized protein n=1 Tax=Zizania palustris TaxID=103762 RepID=A0A8J5S858_ZIZPA|nr:hypothetical protein GUJ93_ZPchr0001g29954 [Zizania palustris]